MSYYDKYRIEIFEIINEEETAEIVEEGGTIYTVVYDRGKVNSFQQIREGLSLFGGCPEIVLQD